MSATAVARDRLIVLCGPREWNQTREHWLGVGARKAGLKYRRAYSLFYNQRLKLSAEEYVAIEHAYHAMASLRRLAREAEIAADRAVGRAG